MDPNKERFLDLLAAVAVLAACVGSNSRSRELRAEFYDQHFKRLGLGRLFDHFGEEFSAVLELTLQSLTDREMRRSILLWVSKYQ